MTAVTFVVRRARPLELAFEFTGLSVKIVIQCPLIAPWLLQPVLSGGQHLRTYPDPGPRKLCEMSVFVVKKRFGDIKYIKCEVFEIASRVPLRHAVAPRLKFAPEAWVAFPDQTPHYIVQHVVHV